MNKSTFDILRKFVKDVDFKSTLFKMQFSEVLLNYFNIILELVAINSLWFIT